MTTNNFADSGLFTRFMKTGQALAYGGTATMTVLSIMAIFHGHFWAGIVGLAATVTVVGIICLIAGTVELVVCTSATLANFGAVIQAIADHAGFDIEELVASAESDVS